MNKSPVTRVSLADAKAMKARGEMFHDPGTPVGESLGGDFWAKAQVVEQDARASALRETLDASIARGGRHSSSEVAAALDAEMVALEKQAFNDRT